MREVKTAKEAGMKIVAKISEAELAVRLCEANYGLRRPAGLTAEEALEHMDERVRDGWRRSAQAAMLYWAECISTMQPMN